MEQISERASKALSLAHHGDPEAEYFSARTSIGVLDASFLTVVRTEGKDRLEYLNRRLAQRVIELPTGRFVRAALLNGDGRMEADMEVLAISDDVTLLVAPPHVTGEYLHFLADKYVFSEEVRFTDVSAEWSAVAVVGPKAGELLGDVAAGELAMNGDAIKFRSTFFPDAIVELIPFHASDAGTRAPKLVEAARRFGGSALGMLAFDTLRIEAGIPWWGIDLTEKSIPLEADLWLAIHTNKGCYPGQETIAKIMNLGHPARKMVGVVFDGEDPLPVGTVLRAGEAEAGLLTSSTYSPRLKKALGLAMVRWPHRIEDTALTAGPLTARVVALPFK